MRGLRDASIIWHFNVCWNILVLVTHLRFMGNLGGMFFLHYLVGSREVSIWKRILKFIAFLWVERFQKSFLVTRSFFVLPDLKLHGCLLSLPIYFEAFSVQFFFFADFGLVERFLSFLCSRFSLCSGF